MGALTTVSIILGILLLLMLPFQLSWRFCLTVNEEEGITLVLKVGPFRFHVYPTRPKKIRARHYTERALKKKKQKEAKKAAEKAKKESEKKARKEKEASEGKKKQKVNTRSALSLSRFVLRTLEIFLRKFSRHIRIVIRELQIIIATDDPAKTATLYGVVCPTADAILQLTESHLRQVRIKPNAPIACYADFLSQTSRVRIRIDFRIRPRQLIASIFPVIRRTVADGRIGKLLFHRSH